MQINPNYTFKNNAPSFGVEISSKLFPSMDRLMSQVFAVDKYMRLREIRQRAPITHQKGIKQRLKKLALNVWHWIKKPNESIKNLNFEETADLIGVRQRLKTSLNVIDLAMPNTSAELFPYISPRSGKAYLAVKTPRKTILLREINKGKFNKPENIDSLRLKLSDVEAASLKLYDLDKKNQRFNHWKTILPMGVTGKF